MRPVGGGACAASTTFPHIVHKVFTEPHKTSQSLHRASQNFTKSSHIVHITTHSSHAALTKSHILITTLSQILHTCITRSLRSRAALAPLLQPPTSSVTKGTHSPYNYPTSSLIKNSQRVHIDPIPSTTSSVTKGIQSPL